MLERRTFFSSVSYTLTEDGTTHRTRYWFRRRDAERAFFALADALLGVAPPHLAEGGYPSVEAFVLSGEDWERFEALLDAPAFDTPKLKRLLSEPTVFDQAESSAPWSRAASWRSVSEK